MRTYEFTITLCGTGKDDTEAWQDACEGFSLDPGCPPENPQLIEDDGDE